MTKLYEYLKKYRIILIIILIIIIIVLVFFSMLGHEIDKTAIKIDAVLGGNKIFRYDQDKYKCTQGDIQTTISEDKSLKVTIECVGNLDRIYNKVYQLPNKNILYVKLSKNKEQILLKAKLFDTKTNKFKFVNPNMLEETDFVYGKNKALPRNKILISRSIFYNQENNQFYKIPRKNMTAYFNFVKEPGKEYKYIQFWSKFKDGTFLYHAEKYTNTDSHYAVWWVEDRIALKRFKVIKLEKVSIFTKKYKNEVFFVDDEFHLCSYNIITAKKKILAKFKNLIDPEQLIFYQNKIIVIDWHYPNKIKISMFNLKTNKRESYKISLNSDYKILPYWRLLNDGNVLFYNFFDKQAYLFDLNTKKQLVIENSVIPLGNKAKCLQSVNFKCNINIFRSNNISMDSNFNLHIIPISPSKAIITGGSISCYNDIGINDIDLVQRAAIYSGHSFYDLSIKKIKVERINKK